MAMRRPILYDGIANNQRGKGVGAWLSGLFRSAIPLFRSGGKAVGKQLLSSGLDMARDLAFNKVPLKQTFNRRMGEAGDALGEKFKDKISSLSGTGLGGCRKRKSSRGRGSVVKRRTTTTIRKRTKQSGGAKRKQQQTAAAISRLIRRTLLTKQKRGAGRVQKRTKKRKAGKKKRKVNRRRQQQTTLRSAADVFA